MRLLQVRALLVLGFTLLAGCQDYNFNPVGHCLIAPGRERVTLSDISTADVLFVVDDSGSMAGEQAAVAAGFDRFIQNLDETNQLRRSNGLAPIDFHIAVTTTSVFINNPTTASCRADCPQAAGAQVCCETSGTTPLRPMRTVKRCAADTECTVAGTSCREDCVGLLGEKVCCNTAAPHTAPVTEAVACTTPGAACGRLETHFRVDGACTPGNAQAGGLYPQGAFIGTGANPRVLHFDKELYPERDAQDQPIRSANLPPCSDGSKVCNKQGFTAAQLKGWFAANPGGNVLAGTCGSGQEQGLQAARLAIQKAVAGQQRDTVGPNGASGSFPAQFLHDNAKLVLVFVGDEDDCSSPQDPTRGVILSGAPGNDACVNDGGLKQFPVAEIVQYFEGLGRPLGAAFIVSTRDVCQDASCTPGQCCGQSCTDPASGAPVCRNATCGGQGPGVRLLNAAETLRSRNADVVAGSICDPNFDEVLNRVAEIVKPPSGLLLPTQPASGDITLLRIARRDGATRKTCRGPAPAGLTATDANAAGYDWWFTASREQVTDEQKAATAVSRFIYINPASGQCKANPGETYSADYLGKLPQSGCVSRETCYDAFGGRPLRDTDPPSWTCYAGGSAEAGFVNPATVVGGGTCTCASPEDATNGSF